MRNPHDPFEPRTTHGIRPLAACLLTTLLLASPLLGQDDDFDDYGPKPTGSAEAKKQYEANLEAHKDNPDMLVLPGLVADRKERVVKVLGEATGLAADELAEFLLVHESSSHGYEALLWSFAKPSDVHRALEFIGLKPGTPFNPAALRFWADGDRVIVALQDDTGEAFPIERLILDTESEETLPEEGFVFAGSMTLPPPGGKGEAVYAADAYDPRSVASIYNEPAAVLDVPRQANKGEVYGSQVVNPEYALEGGEMLTILITPQDPDRERVVRQLDLALDSGSGSNSLACRLSEEDGKVLYEEPSLSTILDRMVALAKESDETHVALSFGAAVPIQHVGKTCAVMAMMEAMGLVRVTPPEDGQLYYRAFVPNSEWREPEGRPSQPWELRLARKDEKVAGRMVLNKTIWSDDGSSRTFERQESPVSVPADVRGVLDRDAKAREGPNTATPPPVVLVFAERGLTYGEVMSYVAPALTTHSTAYVFVE